MMRASYHYATRHDSSHQQLRQCFRLTIVTPQWTPKWQFIPINSFHPRIDIFVSSALCGIVTLPVCKDSKKYHVIYNCSNVHGAMDRSKKHCDIKQMQQVSAVTYPAYAGAKFILLSDSCLPRILILLHTGCLNSLDLISRPSPDSYPGRYQWSGQRART